MGLRPHLIDFMFHGSGGSDFLQFAKKKVLGLLHMRTSTNLRCRDARKKINDIHGVFMFFILFFTCHPGHNFRWEIRET